MKTSIKLKSLGIDKLTTLATKEFLSCNSIEELKENSTYTYKGIKYNIGSYRKSLAESFLNEKSKEIKLEIIMHANSIHERFLEVTSNSESTHNNDLLKKYYDLEINSIKEKISLLQAEINNLQIDKYSIMCGEDVNIIAIASNTSTCKKHLTKDEIKQLEKNVYMEKAKKYIYDFDVRKSQKKIDFNSYIYEKELELYEIYKLLENTNYPTKINVNKINKLQKEIDELKYLENNYNSENLDDKNKINKLKFKYKTILDEYNGDKKEFIKKFNYIDNEFFINRQKKKIDEKELIIQNHFKTFFNHVSIKALTTNTTCYINDEKINIGSLWKFRKERVEFPRSLEEKNNIQNTYEAINEDFFSDNISTINKDLKIGDIVKCKEENLSTQFVIVNISPSSKLCDIESQKEDIKVHRMCINSLIKV